MNKCRAYKRILYVLCSMFLTIALWGCNNETVTPPVEEPTIAPIDKDADNYISNDTVIVLTVDTTEHKISCQNIETGLRYTLNYDTLTVFTSRKGQPLSEAQLTTGGIADISFRAGDELLKELKYSEEYFCISQVENYEIYNNDTRFKYLGDQYILDDYLYIAQDNRSLELMEIFEDDVLTIYGKGNKIYSISVDTGHGYLRLTNDSYFVGGFIEVGDDIIVPITENMLLTVPEGSYGVIVSNEGIVGKKTVTIGRNQEVTLDLGDIDVEKKYGNILFVTNPENSKVYIDGEKQDIGAPIKLEYGVHQLIVMADGYETLSKYINVGSESASVELSLTKQEKENKVEAPTPTPTETPAPTQTPLLGLAPQTTATPAPGATTGNPPSEGNTTTVVNPDGSITTTDANGNTSTTPANKLDNSQIQNTAKQYAYVYIDAPTDCEVYVDGSYVGIAPTSFKKKVGGITVTLRKDGYQTKSYTINLEDEKEDVRYSFAELKTLQ